MQNLFQVTNQRVIYFKITTLVFLYKILLMKLEFRSVKELSGRTNFHSSLPAVKSRTFVLWLSRLSDNTTGHLCIRSMPRLDGDIDLEMFL